MSTTHCDSEDGARVCRHLRLWGGDRNDRRRFLCAREGARHEWEVHRDDHDRPVARADCEGFGPRGEGDRMAVAKIAERHGWDPVDQAAPWQQLQIDMMMRMSRAIRQIPGINEGDNYDAKIADYVREHVRLLDELARAKAALAEGECRKSPLPRRKREDDWCVDGFRESFEARRRRCIKSLEPKPDLRMGGVMTWAFEALEEAQEVVDTQYTHIDRLKARIAELEAACETVVVTARGNRYGLTTAEVFGAQLLAAREVEEALGTEAVAKIAARHGWDPADQAARLCSAWWTETAPEPPNAADRQECLTCGGDPYVQPCEDCGATGHEGDAPDYYCGCEHHRPGPDATANWDGDGWCLACGEEVDPWTIRALRAEAEVERLRGLLTREEDSK